MHRLQQFVVGTLLPKLSRLALTIGGRPAWAAETRAELVEAFLWLHLGMEIGSFPEQPSRDVYKTYLSPFFKSLLQPNRETSEAMRDGPEYVPHSAESRELLSAAPRYSRVLVEMAMREEEGGAEDIFVREQAGLKDSVAMQGLFQTLLLLHSSFDASPAVRQFTYEMSFVEQDVWRQDWEADSHPEEVREADISGSASPIALTLAGYLTFWGHGGRCAEALASFDGNEAASSSQIFRLKQRLREIYSWRITLQSRFAAKRFEAVQQRFAQYLAQETTTQGIDPRCAVTIQESMESAFELWGVRVLVNA